MSLIVSSKAKCLATQAIIAFMEDGLRCINCYPKTCKSFQYCIELLDEHPEWLARMSDINFWGTIGPHWNELEKLYNEMCEILIYENNKNVQLDNEFMGKKFCELIEYYANQSCLIFDNDIDLYEDIWDFN